MDLNIKADIEGLYVYKSMYLHFYRYIYVRIFHPKATNTFRQMRCLLKFINAPWITCTVHKINMVKISIQNRTWEQNLLPHKNVRQTKNYVKIILEICNFKRKINWERERKLVTVSQFRMFFMGLLLRYSTKQNSYLWKEKKNI